MEEENRINAYLVNEKYPKEIESYKQKLKNCEVVASKSVMSQAELNEIKKKIDDTNKELSNLMEKRDKNRDLSDEKLIMFRQQAIIIGRKRDQMADNLNEVRNEHSHLEKQLKEKRKRFGEEGGVLKGEDVINVFSLNFQIFIYLSNPSYLNITFFKFKKYVIKLRSKGNTYKSKRQEIAELQTEYITLKRTEEILKSKFDSVKEHLVICLQSIK